MYQNIENPNVLEGIVKRAEKTSDIIGMCIWGSFADEVPGIHLGHLYMMNKIWELAENRIRMSICINGKPVLDPDKKNMQDLAKRHAGITASMLHVLSDLTAGGVGLDAIYVGRDETDKLRQENSREFDQVQQVLEKARHEIENEFVPLRAEGPKISEETILKFRAGICTRLKLDETAFRELVELFAIRNKAHASTQWASDFGATLQLMEQTPAFLLVGQRHGYIWALYDCMFRRSELPRIPVVRLKNFMDCIGAKPMNSREPERCICLVDSEEIIRDNFSKGLHLKQSEKMFALRDVFEKLIFTRGNTLSISNRKYGSYEDLLDAAKSREGFIVDAAMEFLKQCYSSVVPVLSSIILAEYPRPRFDADNYTILNNIAEDMPIEQREKVKNLDKSVNREPQSHRDIYDEVLDTAILGSILNLRTIDEPLGKEPLVRAAFDKVKELVRATRDMDILPYQIAKRHRDHYYHQINVGGLGAMLLDVHNSNGGPLWKHMADWLKLSGDDEVKKRKVKAIWWITALLHDHAYALAHAFTFLPNLLILKDSVASNQAVVEEAFEAHRKLLRPMMTSDLEKNVFKPLYENHAEEARDGLEEMVDVWLAHIPGLKPAGVEDRKEILKVADNHGVMGAVNLLSHISADKLKGNEPNVEWKHAFGAIAGAILVHHLPEKPRISFDQHPLSFLLAFVDEIQEWSRLYVHDGAYKACLEKIEVGYFSRALERPGILTFTDHLEVIFLFGNEDMLKEIEWDRERFHKDKAEGIGRLVLPDAALKSGFPSKIKWHEAYVSEGKLG